ncbi:MAG: hypothetical protein ACLUGI_12380 [Subdoligranulum sp.]
MSKLNIDQKSVKALFSEKKADFLIPDYQRPYAWGEKGMSDTLGRFVPDLHFLITIATNLKAIVMNTF